MAILLDILPPARHARMTLVASVISLLGILSGPASAGWLSEYRGWQPLVFYFSLPMAGCIFLVVAVALPERRAAQTPPFDFFGLATFSVGILGLQMLLDRGERIDGSIRENLGWRRGLGAGVLPLFVVHVLTAEKTHFFDKALLGTRNFVLSAVPVNSRSASSCCRPSR